MGPSMVMWLSSYTAISRPRPRCPASDAASWLTPSWKSPSEQKVKTWWSVTSGPNRARRLASAIASPTALPMPWPSGPVVTSMPGRVAAFGVAGGLRAPLAELLEVLEGEAVPGQVQHRVQQHRRVTAGEHEPVAVGPIGRLRVVAHDARPEHVRERCERHRRSGVAGVRLLDRIHREPADDVDRPLLELGRHR